MCERAQGHWNVNVWPGPERGRGPLRDGSGAGVHAPIRRHGHADEGSNDDWKNGKQQARAI